jgi:hypothetical protein
MTPFYLLLALLSFQVSFAAEIPSDPHIYDEKPGPHGGKVLHTHHRNFEVSRKATKKLLDVYLPKSDGPPPKNLQMTLLKSGKTDQTLDLKPVPSAPDDQFYHYQAVPVPNDTNVVPAEESQAAFGFTFDLDPKQKE